jgi:cell division protein FtsI (penicillin-binding protein 3)
MPPPVRPSLNSDTAPRATPMKRTRFWLICLFFLIWALAIAGRLFWLQVARYQEFADRARNQQQERITVAPQRGVLYDRNLRELAMTVQVDSVCADPNLIKDKPATAHLLASVVHIDPDDAQTTEEQIAARLAAGKDFAWVARRVTPETSARVHQLINSQSLQGIGFRKEFQRFYPGNEVAAQLLGYVGADDNGLGGLEQKFDARMHGVPGEEHKSVDARRHALGSSVREPEPGQNLVLTIDEYIQSMAERALDHAMERTHAANGTVVVQDVYTGQILALAIRPTFNPNIFRHTTPELLRNHAISDVYEPGSVFKLVAYSAALDQHVAAPDDNIDCQGGTIKMPGGRIIHDNQGEHYGVISVHKALEVSSDVAAVKLALKVGPDHFYQYIRDFGFGARTGAELPGETRGLLRPVSKWGASSIGSIAIGQEVGVTPLQLVSMVSTIANGGVYLPPRVLMPGQVDGGDNGQTKAGTAPKTPLAAPQVSQLPSHELPNPLPAGARRVISTMTAAQMRKMMEGVVIDGTGKEARLNGYSSGGKTGTAQKVDPATHLYSKTMHIASFAGIAPVNNPVIAVAVILDDPKGGYYGATVSAPVFAEVAQQVLEYLAVPHDTDLRLPRAPKSNVKVAEDDASEHTGDINALYAAANDLPSDDPLRGGGEPAIATQGAAASSQTNAQPVSAAANTNSPNSARPRQTASQSATATVVLADGKTLRVPSLAGLSVRKVIEQAAAAGLEVEISGSGTVREQAPAAGTMVAPGTKIVVKCGR